MDRFLPVRFSMNYKLYVSGGKYAVKGAKTIKKFVFQSVMDYLSSFLVDYDKHTYDKCIAEIKPLVPEVLSFFFTSRTTSHHLRLVLDGIVKTRCLLEKDSTWVATEQDYARFTDWLRDWVKWWWDEKLPEGKTVTKILNTEQKAIVELVGKGTSRTTLIKYLKERNIEMKYNMKFLYDNGVLGNDDNNVYPLIDTNESELNIDDIEV